MRSESDPFFYDAYPFDWAGHYSPSEMDAALSPLLRRVIAECGREGLTLDVGCGTGRVMRCLGTAPCVGIDLSYRSVSIMRDRIQKEGVVADNLNLPLPDNVASLVISDGVAHHTADPRMAFRENCRILREGGWLYLSLYKPGGRYPFLYRYPGQVVRWSVRHRVAKLLLESSLVPLYFAVHWLKYRGTPHWNATRSVFYDYFASPRVTFLSRDEIDEWCSECGMAIADYDSNPSGTTHSFLLRKETRVHSRG